MPHRENTSSSTPPDSVQDGEKGQERDFRPDLVEDHHAHGLRDGLAGMRDLMERLLGEEGCAWDREQNLDSLRPYLLEECYEVLESMDDPAAHRGELGDLLFQIVFQSALREREGAFTLDDVLEGIRSKMIRRHPHVFGTAEELERQRGMSAEQVSRQWAAIKAKERAALGAAQARHSSPIPDPLAGVPAALPALQRAWRLQDKAAAVGFDWPDLNGPIAKVDEEWAELREAMAANDPSAIADELGDLLFVLVRLGQKLGIEAEGALRGTIDKFQTRFAGVMQKAHEAGIDPPDAGLEQLDAWWNEVKAEARKSNTGGDQGAST
jgi:MazG family protein